jgi:protein ImuB
VAEPPVLVVRTISQRREVHACCRACAAAGVRAGLTLAHARALLPEGLALRVMVIEHDGTKQDAALERLAHWATRFSPIVAPERDAARGGDGLVLDITGCAHLFGGEAGLLSRLVGDLSRLGFTGRAVAAPTPACAWAVARFGRLRATEAGHRREPKGKARTLSVASGEEAEALASLPVEALRIEPAVVAGLERVGVRRVEEVARLPRGELAKRYGADLPLRLDAALGRALPEPVQGVRVPPPVRAERAFAGPTTRLEAVMLAAQEVIAELCDLLERRVIGVREAVLTLRRVDAEPVSMTARLSRPTADARHLWSLLRPRVEKSHLGFGVEGVEMLALRTGRLTLAQQSLHHASAPDGRGASASQRSTDAPSNPHRMPDRSPRPVAALRSELPAALLIDTLAARLGEDRVLRLRPVERHEPRRAWRLEPALHTCTRGFDRTLVETALTTHERPTTMLDRPEPTQAIALRPDGPPTRLCWRGSDRSVLHADGPERLVTREGPHTTRTGREQAAPASACASAPAVLDCYRVQIETGEWLWCARWHHADDGPSRWFILGHW